MLTDLDALASGEAVSTPHTADVAEYAEAVPVGAAVSYAGPPGGEAKVRGAYLHYLAAVGRSVVFLRKPGNIITFFILWILLALREVMQSALSLAPCLLVPFVGSGLLIITGWYMAFKMNLVSWAAGEEEELPPLMAEQGVLDDVVIPAFRMFMTYLFALLPGGIFFTLLIYRVGSAIAANTAGIAPFANPVPGLSAIVVLAMLALTGLFAWPMMVLTVSCGGSIKALFRLDLIGETMLKSLPAYLLTVFAVYVTFAVQTGVTMLIWANVDQSKNWWDDWFAIFGLPILLVGVSLYFDIVAMRAIGYYYACFKHKFAWSWG